MPGISPRGSVSSGPPSAGVASALGLLLAPDRVATVAESLARLDWDRFEATYRRIEEECRSVLAHAGLAPETARIVRSADLQFRGQVFEIVVELPAVPYTRASEGTIADAFRAAYERAFYWVPPGVGTERGSTSGSRRGRGAKAGETRRQALKSGPRAGSAMPARGPGSRTSPSTVDRCGRRSSIATCFAPETAFRVRQSSKSASRPPARDPRAEHHAAERDTETPVSPTSAVS